MFDVLAPPSGSRPIVMLGDSLTAMCEWHELLGHRGLILNRGIGGDTSAGVLKRSRALGVLRPAAVFVMIGTNDAQLLGFTPEETARNYGEIVRTLLMASPSTKIYAQTILPSRTPKFNTWSEEANRLIRKLADGKSVRYLDLRPAFLQKGLISESLTSDGIHLNAQGYVLWKRQILPILDSLRNGRSKPSREGNL